MEYYWAYVNNNIVWVDVSELVFQCHASWLYEYYSIDGEEFDYTLRGRVDNKHGYTNLLIEGVSPVVDRAKSRDILNDLVNKAAYKVSDRVRLEYYIYDPDPRSIHDEHIVGDIETWGGGE